MRRENKPGKRDFIYTHCPLCKESGFKPFLLQHGMDLMYCVNCSFLIKNPQPTKEYLQERGYLEKEKNYSITDCYRIKEFLFQEIHSHFDSLEEVSLLDVESCEASFLTDLSKAGITPVSVVEDQELASNLREESGLNTICTESLIRYAKGVHDRFDVILFRFSLETQHHLHESLLAAQKLLKENGKIIIVTNNVVNRYLSSGGWRGFERDSQLYYFSPGTMRNLLKKERFHPEHIYTLPRYCQKETPLLKWSRLLLRSTGLGFFLIAVASKRTVMIKLREMKTKRASYVLDNQKCNKVKEKS